MSSSQRTRAFLSVLSMMRRVSRLSRRLEAKAPQLQAHYALNGAWRKLEEAQRLLAGTAQRKAR